LKLLSYTKKESSQVSKLVLENKEIVPFLRYKAGKSEITICRYLVYFSLFFNCLCMFSYKIKYAYTLEPALSRYPHSNSSLTPKYHT